MRRTFSFLLLMALPALLRAAPHVTAVRHWTAPDHTRIVLDISSSYQFEVTTRRAPERVVIDIPKGGFRCDTEPCPIGDRLVERLRCNQLRRGAQVVLDLKGEFSYKYFALDAIPGEKPRRIVVDVYPRERSVARATPTTAKPAREEKPPAGREIVVVIDPGHGGEDPGAIHKGQREKIITLDVARRLKRKLDAMPGYRAVLTRDGDYTVTLARRRQLAEKAGGDILISIHCNTAPNRHARGVEVFYLSTRGASSRRAQALADLENRADFVGGIHPRAREEEVKLVVSERLKTSIKRSGHLAGTLSDRARAHTGLRSRGVKRAAFAICKMVSMPSVLVELGFLSNSNDRTLLGGKKGRQKYADWLGVAVDGYFRRYPSMLYDPLFSRKDKLVYKVKRGDSLSRIAQRYDVSVNDLVRANGLSSRDMLRVGQLLLVVADEAQPVLHKVRRGENLTAIARRYGVSVDSLVETNRLAKRDLLRVGQQLLIIPGLGSGG